jgi:hypothetical protein
MSVRPTKLTTSDYWEWDALARDRRWTDGLPVAPPTDDRVEAILDFVGGHPQRNLGTIPPAQGNATLEQVAIQCAMAGCLPEHVPVVLTALEAMLDTEFNLGGVQATTNPCAPLVIVNGPVVHDLGINVRHGVFGGGAHANAAIGRAVRMILWNIGGGKPGVTDMSPLGQPAKYAFCIGENEEDSPWPGIHTDHGIPTEQSAVTVFACQSPHPVTICGTASQMLELMGESLPTTTINMYHAAGQFLLVLSLKPAQEFARAGYDKSMIRQWLFDNARYDVGQLRHRGLLAVPDNPVSTYWGETRERSKRPDLDSLPDDARLPLVESVNDIHIVVTGGAAQWWAGFCAGWGGYGGYSQTRAMAIRQTVASTSS